MLLVLDSCSKAFDGPAVYRLTEPPNLGVRDPRNGPQPYLSGFYSNLLHDVALELRASVGAWHLLPCVGHTYSLGPQAKILPDPSLPNPSSFQVLEGGERHTQKLQARSHLPSLPCSWAFAVRCICLPAQSQQLGAKEAETVGTLSW